MKKIGLFYGVSTVKTSEIAQKIKDAFTGVTVDAIPVEDAWEKEFGSYDFLIVGASTWFDGELPTYWDEVLPALSSMDLKGKKVAVFGLGDQVHYPDNFVDGIGILAETFEATGATLVGFTSVDGYTFNYSKAQRDNQFVGLAIDIENQPDKNDERVKNWVNQLTKEFKI